ncbi:MAG: hypothetical protein IPM69_18795 [Ignavibacteria bacterium]|nr:hypothetical protein [Ignavibacteria bacterium]
MSLTHMTQLPIMLPQDDMAMIDVAAGEIIFIKPVTVFSIYTVINS